MAVTDALTGVGNRYCLLNQAQTLIQSAQSTQQSLSVFLFDVDFFQKY